MAYGDLWVCGANPDGVYRSQDDGATWGALIPGPAGQNFFTGLSFHPDTGDLWVCGTSPNGIYRSQDDGATWGALIPGPAGQSAITGLGFHPDTGDLWVCGTSPDGVYRSQDDGATWSALIPGPAGQNTITGLGFHPDTGDLWVCGTSPDGNYRSQDDGATWGALIPGPAGQNTITGLGFHPDTGDLWVCGTSPNGIYRSQDDGATWGALIPGPAGQTQIGDLEFDFRGATPDVPDAPTATALFSTSIRATGTAPDAQPDIDSYDWRYRVVGTAAWTDRLDQTDLTQTFTGLDPSREYEVQFRATNSVGDSDYSPSGTAQTSNANPSVTVDTQDQTVDAGATVSLTATATDLGGGSIASYLWTGSGTFDATTAEDTDWDAPSPSSQTDYELRLTVTDDEGGTAFATVTITVRSSGASITDTQVTSTPEALSDTYGLDETIEFTVTWDGPVDVTGNPRFPMNLGQSPSGSPEYADYAGGTGSAEITFEWVVSATDEDTNGVFLYGNTDPQNRGDIDLNGGTIRNAGTQIDANLTTVNRGTQSAHKVDGSLGAAELEVRGSAAAGAAVARARLDVLTARQVRGEASAGGAVVTAHVQTTPAPITGFSFSLGDIPAGTTWSGSLPIPTYLVAGGVEADLELFGNIIGTFVFQTSGPDLTAVWEGYATAIRVIDDAGASIVIAGPAHPNNTSNDPREPYTWIPGNRAAVDAWFDVDRTGVTLVLDDGIDRPTVQVRGEVAAGNPVARARLDLLSAHDIQGTAGGGDPAVRARVDLLSARYVRGTAAASAPVATAHVATTLALDGFNRVGRIVDALALITANVVPRGDQNTLYADTNRGGTDSVDDGELGDWGGRDPYHADRVHSRVRGRYASTTTTCRPRLIWRPISPLSAVSRRAS